MKTLYFGGSIITLEKELYVEAVLVEDGIIKRVGKKEDLLQENPDVQVDLQGKTMTPSFIDPHSHIMGVAANILSVDLSSATSFAEIISLIKDFRTRNPNAKGINGVGYDHNYLAEKRHPDRHVLDQACDDIPVNIAHASHHMGVLNTKALEVIEITSNTKDPEGGKIGRDDDGSTPNGYLEEIAYTNFTGNLPRPTTEEMMDCMVKAQDTYLKYGITTVQDGFTPYGCVFLYKDLAENNKFKIDIVSYLDAENCRELIKCNPEYIKQYHNHYKIGGYKIFLDGSPQGRTAWVSKPYLGGEDGYCGYPIHKDDKVIKIMEQALEDDMQILTHCNGDEAAEQLIRSYEEALKNKGKPSLIRPVMIHAQLCRPDQLERMAKIDMIASFFIAHTYYWGDIHLQNFGEERAKRISAAGSAVKYGTKFTLHQDSPVIKSDMLETIWCAVNRISKSGVDMGEGERITPLQALEGVTINPAYQYFEENQKGSIKPGKIADLVILSDDPLKVDPMKIKDIEVLETIKDGVSLYKK